ncbi:MAG TPA: ferrochelatase [Burkholderiales bacterium]|nr:ferrochelatase [Burkholderiales bacterium]
MESTRGALLLVNLGTPAAPTAPAVRAYLAEFLSDPRVVKLPRWLWLPILYGVVLRTRPAKSAEKYAQIWTPEGSPLAVNTVRQAALLQEKLGIPVKYAMRYGRPAVADVVKTLENPVVVPLYPQYAESTTESVRDVLPPGTRMIESFHDHPAYIAALEANVRRHWDKYGRGAVLVMSFHGLPKKNSQRYETECRETGALLAQALGLKEPAWQVTFQSRFGYADWLQPYTEPTLVVLAREGVKRVDVVCPGFVADCLETLEEIGITARHAFLAAGGDELYLVSCLNDSPEWISALAQVARA